MSLKKPIRKSASAPDEDAPKPKDKSKGKSLADQFDATPAGGGFTFPVGKFNVKIESFTMDENEKGESACVEYIGHEDEDAEVAGKTLKQYYKLSDAEGNASAGIGFLKADLEKLGYSDVSYADLAVTLREITREQPVVEIQTKKNGQYINAYMQGVVAE